MLEIDFSPSKTVIELKLGVIQTSFALLWSQEVLLLLPQQGLNKSPFEGIVGLKCTDAKKLKWGNFISYQKPF